jgi:hypothetical protein
MQLDPHKAWQTRPGLLVLLFCALLLRTLIPAGYMVGPAASGGPALILCADAADEPVRHGAHQQPHSPRQGESQCPYAALAAPALPPTPVPLAVQPPAPVQAPRATLFASLRPVPAASTPPATGPPASA